MANVPEHNSTLGHDYSARSDSFLGEDFDCRILLQVPPPRFALKEGPKIGLVGFNTASGIGSCNRDLARHLPIHRWLIVEHRHLPTQEIPDGVVAVVSRPEESGRALRQLCAEVDILLFVETEFVAQQTNIAKQSGIQTVCIPMIEWLPPGGWPDLIDVFLCPTIQTHSMLSLEHPGRSYPFPWPVDLELFAFRERRVCDRFLFINGHGGHEQRKGGDVIRRAAEIAPEIPIIVYDQTHDTWPATCDIRGEAPDRASLYAEGAVLLLPAKFNGIGLEQLEAMASGLPVIATNGPPMNELPCLDLIECNVDHASSARRPRRLPISIPRAEHLAHLLTLWFGRNVSVQSEMARRFAESRTWKGAYSRLREACCR